MDESEQALSDAARSASSIESRIARQVLGDPKIHRLWEFRHTELVRPVAEQSRRLPQVLALRSIEVGLSHRRALFDHIRKYEIVGPARDKLFSVFYGPRDTIDALATEHRQYMLAVSSSLSVAHLFRVMHDPVSTNLLKLYQTTYAEYFALYCLMVTSEDAAIADALQIVMKDVDAREKSLRRRLSSAKPERGSADFDRQAALARSGRYPILDYMVR